MEKFLIGAVVVGYKEGIFIFKIKPQHFEPNPKQRGWDYLGFNPIAGKYVCVFVSNLAVSQALVDPLPKYFNEIYKKLSI